MTEYNKFGQERNSGISSLQDKRLVKVDPSQSGFYDKFLYYHSANKNIRILKEMIAETKKQNLGVFYSPIIAPSFKEGQIVFDISNRPAEGYYYNWWINRCKEMPTVDEKKWALGTEYQHYAYLVYLFNTLVKNGFTMNKAMEVIVYGLEEARGGYQNLERDPINFEKMGNPYKKYNIGYLNKYLASTKDGVNFWIAGGFCSIGKHSLSIVNDCYDPLKCHRFTTGWILLS